MPEPISYTLRFPAPQTHYVEVEALIPTGGQPAVELMMAVWTPGSYLVREYARNVEAVSAATEPGRAARASRRRSKNRWRITTGRRAAGASSATGSTAGRCRCAPTSSTPASPCSTAPPTFLTLAGARAPAARRAGWSLPAGLEGRGEPALPPTPAAGDAPLTGRRTSTRWSTRRSTPATRRSTASRSRQAAPAGQRGGGRRLGRPPLGRGRRRRSCASRPPSGAACPTTATSSSTCSPRAAAGWSTRTPAC